MSVFQFFVFLWYHPYWNPLNCHHPKCCEARYESPFYGQYGEAKAARSWVIRFEVSGCYPIQQSPPRLTWPMAKLFQLLGITYLVGKTKVQTFISGFHWLSEKILIHLHHCFYILLVGKKMTDILRVVLFV